MNSPSAAPNFGRLELLLARPRGFCAGVERAIDIVELVLKRFGGPVHVRHELVHNRHVVDDFRRRGVIFVEQLHEVPDGAIVVFSAHGVSEHVQAEAQRRRLTVFDATCPLVTKVHVEVAGHARAGRECILIGHSGHPEVEGTMGRYDHRVAAGGAIHLVEDRAQAEALEVGNPQHLAYVTQTTLSVDDTRSILDILKQRFPAIIGPRRDDICYATQNRQDAVRQLTEHCDVMLVVGSPSSSNSNRLRELAARAGCRAFLLDGATELQPQWFEDGDVVGITAGASAPETLVQEVVARLRQWGGAEPEEQRSEPENVRFVLPRELR